MATLVDHYRRREIEEREHAEEAETPKARAAHLQLARLFREKAEDLARVLHPRV